MNDNRGGLHESLLLLCDTQNLFYTAREAYGVAARIDFKKLKEVADNGRRFKHIVRRAYLSAKPDGKQDAFVGALEKLSYEVVVVPIREHQDGSTSGTNIDEHLAKDLTTVKFDGRDPEVVVVASGDSDFVPMYRTLKDRGVRVEVMSFLPALGTSIGDVVDEVTKLTRDHLFTDSVPEMRGVQDLRKQLKNLQDARGSTIAGLEDQIKEVQESARKKVDDLKTQTDQILTVAKNQVESLQKKIQDVSRDTEQRLLNIETLIADAQNKRKRYLVP